MSTQRDTSTQLEFEQEQCLALKDIFARSVISVPEDKYEETLHGGGFDEDPMSAI